jgi:cell wall-associated NlpC family hydrolase
LAFSVHVSLLRFALPRRLVGCALAALFGLVLAVNPATAPHADAAVPASVSYAAVRVAASQAGVRYRIGGTSPRTGFDCSGLTRYAYGKVGKRLPRTAQQQYAAALKIARKSARPGDLVFFTSGSRVSHVAIYAGSGYVWHAPKPGKRVAKARIWTSAVSFGRVR